MGCLLGLFSRENGEKGIYMKEKLLVFLRMPLTQKIVNVKRLLYCHINKARFGHIGRGSYIRKPIMLTNTKQMYIGDYVHICFGARIECIKSWKQTSYHPKIEIGNGTVIGQNFHMTCADHIVLEDDVTCSNSVVITDINHAHNLVDIHCLDQDLEVSEVHIKQYAFIGSGAVILPGVTIGKNAIIGARAVVTKSVPDDCMAVGIPAKVIKRYDRESKEWKSC